MTIGRAPQEFFSCDWGTSSFRLRRVRRETGEILEELREPIGVKAVLAQLRDETKEERERIFAEFLAEKTALLLPHEFSEHIQIIVSGMASSSVGWKEVPYALAPIPLDGRGVRFEKAQISVRRRKAEVALVGGVQTKTEIMRGEETEVFGLLEQPQYQQLRQDGILLLPGTHSKHVTILKGRLRTFQTFMTGELFEVLAAHSLLRATVAAEECPMQALEVEEGVKAAVKKGLSGSLFQARTRSVLGKRTPESNRWFLSGLLIGAELEYLRQLTPRPAILVAATGSMSAAYLTALSVLGLGRNALCVPPGLMAQASVLGHRVLLPRVFGSMP